MSQLLLRALNANRVSFNGSSTESSCKILEKLLIANSRHVQSRAICKRRYCIIIFYHQANTQILRQFDETHASSTICKRIMTFQLLTGENKKIRKIYMTREKFRCNHANRNLQLKTIFMRENSPLCIKR